jgi:hypothetical protein
MYMRRSFLRLMGALLLGLLTLFLASCCWAGVRRSPSATPTPRAGAVASPALPTATLARQLTQIPKPLATTVVQPSKAAPTQPATSAPVGPLVLVDPPLDKLSSILTELPTNGQFRVTLHEQYVSEQAAGYIAAAQDLPVQINDVLVTLSPGAIEISGRAPFGFLRVEVLGRGAWRAESCRFVAEIVEVRIAGQPAPASLRDQMGKLLQDALSNIANAPVCFTRVEIRRGEVEISGYRK